MLAKENMEEVTPHPPLNLLYVNFTHIPSKIAENSPKNAEIGQSKRMFPPSGCFDFFPYLSKLAIIFRLYSS